MQKKKAKFTNKVTAIALACSVLAGSMAISITSMVQKDKISKAYDELLQDKAVQAKKYQLLLKEKENLESQFENATSKEELDKLKSQIAEKDAKIAELVEKNCLASAEAEKYKKHFESLYEMFVSMPEGVENAELKKTIEKKNEEILELTSKYNSALVEIETLKAKLNAGEGDLSIEYQLAEANVKIQKLEDQLGQAVANYEGLVKEYEKVCLENSELKETIKQIESSGALRNDLIKLIIDKYSLSASEVNQMTDEELIDYVYGLVGGELEGSPYDKNNSSNPDYTKEDETNMEKDENEMG